MRTDQCNRCLRYRGELDCDAFPKGIPEKILTGEHDHTTALRNVGELLFLPTPDGEVLAKAEGAALIEHINDLTDREDIAYRRMKTVLQRKGYKEDDFEPGGVLHGRSVNELLEMVRP